MISIIIPLYNQAKKLEATLQSIALQSDQDFEVIVVNDGSSDGAEEVFSRSINNFSGSQKLIFLNQKNQGAPVARNRGARESSGQYLFFCDADVILRPDALAKLRAALEAYPEASYAYSAFYFGGKLFKSFPFDSTRLCKMPYIHTMALIRREHFPAGGFDESLRKFQDWDLWLTMLREGHGGILVPEPLFKVAGGGTMSSWVPSFAYTFLPFLPAVKRYNQAKKIIIKKHGLT